MPKFSILPKQNKFFDLFETASINILEGTQLLCDLMEHYTEVEEKIAQIALADVKSDATVHEMIDLANESLITPIDHEDTQQLIYALDDILHTIETTAARLSIYQIQAPTPIAIQFSRIIHLSAQELGGAISGLRKQKKLKKIKVHLLKIKEYESDGDRLLRSGLTELVSQRDDIFNFLRWKEIYEYLEKVTDQIDDAGGMLERIIIKNA